MSGTMRAAVFHGVNDLRLDKERMRQLMEMVRHGRLDLAPLLTRRFKLDDVLEAYDLIGHQRDGVIKVALSP
jgi:threonine dehydrogenase-like Zn-dependent dehydrogenase